jgi:hypothetical protein
MRFELKPVRYMPKELQPGVLYVSEQFGIAIHLCACGCGSKIRTALGPTEFSVEETPDGPTLRPSVGNWQQACRSHYWITRSNVIWAEAWTPEEIAAGRAHDEARRRAYYEESAIHRARFLPRLWRRTRRLFSRWLLK